MQELSTQKDKPLQFLREFLQELQALIVLSCPSSH
jgi:hypothetical protein